MIVSYTHGREFVRQVRPVLERRDAEALARYLRRDWPNERLRSLLECGHDDAVRVAIVCLSLTGTMADTHAVAVLLQDGDAETARLAEHALWSIWFQAGDDEANVGLVNAVRLIGENRLAEAAAHLDEVVRRSPTFAEAYNQRAIVHFLEGNYPAAIADCRRTLRLNGHHFGALAGLAHNYVSLGQLERALDTYHHALTVHPRLEGIRQSISQIRAYLRQRRVPGGSTSSIS